MRRVGVCTFCSALQLLPPAGRRSLPTALHALSIGRRECAQIFVERNVTIPLSFSQTNTILTSDFELSTRLTRLCSLLLQELLAAAVGDF